MRPRARRKGLLVRELPGELVVYDRETHQAHCLNRSAALVFRSADGRRTVSDIAARMTAELGAGSDELVSSALEGLSSARLLDAWEPESPGPAKRRDALRRIALGAAASLPVVTSLLVPTPAEAANTCIPEAACPGATGQRCYDIDPSECELQTKACTGSGVCS